MAPLLLGVSKQAIMRMDYNTKEVLEEFPMTSFKRWAANDKVFSIDFGKPDKNFYAQTTEGKKIKEQKGQEYIFYISEELGKS